MSDLPSGIVTFLFTDIEGSTRLVERLGDRYADVQSRHDAILRAAIGAGEGREVSTAGDSFFAVFATPAGAVRAAMAAQRELAATSWPDGLAVRVRMGLHSGDGTPHDDDYIGLDVNRAARIAAAAHGGQVLLSDATRVLVEHDLPPDSRLLDLGRHRLKDLLQPERLHQLLMVGLEQDFPPLRTLEARQNNLPAQLTRFIGRHDEVRQLRDRLTRARLVTLTGPGGTGKTRLALQVAAEALSDFEDGVVFVDLSALIEPDLVADEIAGAMNLRAEPGRSTRETLEDHLRDKSLLLVLDNFEQVAEAAHSTLEPLLRAAHRVTALATSRVPLHVQGEQRHAVAPLAVPATGQADDRDAMAQVEAVMLFCDRAAAVRPGFRLTPENARAVAAIVERLDGLPLALELAASRLNILSIEDLLARLDDRLALLSARDRSLPERQRTLRQTIQWSHDLLDEREQGLFRRLSVFAGGVALDAATAVVDPEAGGGSDILDALDSLVEKNLLRPAHDIEDESRFVMLETIREFGLERLAEAGEEDEIRRWHAEHWYAVAARLAAAPAVEQPASARLLGRDQENIRAALGWAIRSGDAELGLRLGAALRDFWRVSGHVREGLDWLERLLSLAGAQAKRT